MKNKGNRFVNLICNASSWKLVLIAVLFRLPYMIAYYPGLMIYDTGSSIAQFYGFSTHVVQVSSTPDAILSNHHMILFTLLMGGAVKIGELIGNQNLGYFLYVIIQVILTNIVFIYGLTVVRKKVTGWPIVIAYLYYILLPVVSLWQITVSKDSLFAVAALFWIILLYRIVESHGELIKDARFDILLLAANLMVILTKAQGAYLSLATFIIVAVVYRKQFLKLIMVGVVPAVFYLTIFTGIILPAAGVAVSGKQEMLGFMFQQTARYVYDYEEDVTEDEATVIDAILPYDELAELYTPYNQDSVKFEYKQSASDEELHSYYTVWFKMFFRHPDSYIKATLLNCKYFFCPQEYNGEIYSYMPVLLEYSDILNEHEEFTLYNTKPFPVFNLVAVTLDKLATLPIISTVFFQIWPFVWLSIASCIVAIIRTRGNATMYVLPIILSILIFSITPDVEVRYALPFIYTLPFLALTATGKSPKPSNSSLI